ncbi:hypothetical protein [Pseudomonas sp. PB106]|uniref:hypothetical protein n=1 Tax=Pseudomonas sp. PB106 TaxID=2494699 RepID=UPI00131C2784|nr:hypothetical protein [Pseudomonas sp. PB106]KAE9648485.1 hypothetical protein EJA71_05210 [Pseudomonas sp. PB106]
MSINDLKLDDRKKSGTGTIKAKINKDYVTDEYDGTPLYFLTDNEIVVLRASYAKPQYGSFEIDLRFHANIKKGRHEFSTEHFPCPFSFSRRIGSGIKGYTSEKNAGFIDIEDFSIDKGTLKASFNFTFTDFDTDQVHQVHDGSIDVQGLEIVD